MRNRRRHWAGLPGEEKAAGGADSCLWSCLKDYHVKDMVDLFRPVSETRRRNQVKLQGRLFGWDIHKNCFRGRAVRWWNCLPQEMVGLPWMEDLEQRLDVAQSHLNCKMGPNKFD